MGPGYRIYFGMDGAALDHPARWWQQDGASRQDIAAAHAHWADYKRRKGQEE